jgi:esterase/lipase superfamily enzyme
MERHQRVIQAALALREELPGILKGESQEADEGLARLIERAVTESPEVVAVEIIRWIERWPELKRRYDELISGAWRGPAATDNAASPDSGYSQVEVLYATDRKATGRTQPDACYSGERSLENPLSFGKCLVSIPDTHARAKLESPLPFLKGDPRKHVLLLTLEPLTGEGFDAEVRKQRDGRSSEVFIFIHGYNVTFEDAVRRTAQLHHDLNFAGTPICFSWPSRAAYFAYAADGASAEWAAPHLAELIRRIRACDEGMRIHLIAHSMGNRTMTMALRELVWKGDPSSKNLHEIVLAAPDIDLPVFNQLAEAIRGAAKRVTLYASSNDRALWVSKLLHRGVRAGDSDPEVAICQGIDSIDASNADSSLLSLGHSYFATKFSILTDISELIRIGTPVNGRVGLKAAPSGKYWVMGR